MTRDEAQAAITGPVTRLPHPVAYEGALLERLLDDLSRGEVELPHLQIVCTQSKYDDVYGHGRARIALESRGKSLSWCHLHTYYSGFAACCQCRVRFVFATKMKRTVAVLAKPRLLS